MGEDGKTNGFRIPILTRENQESFFRQMKIKLKGKQVYYTCETSITGHCQISGPYDSPQEHEEVIGEGFGRTRINITLKAKYCEDEAKAFSIIFESLNEDD